MLSVINRTIPYGYWYSVVVTTIKAEEVRIPRRAREAVARHEQVLVLNRERPVLAIVHPDMLERGPRRRGRPTREIAAMLAGAPFAGSGLRCRHGGSDAQRRTDAGDAVGAVVDTTVFVDMERGARRVATDPGVLVGKRLEQCLGPDEEVAIAAITASELLHGVHRATRSTARREAFVEAVLSVVPVLDFDLLAAAPRETSGGPDVCGS